MNKEIEKLKLGVNTYDAIYLSMNEDEHGYLSIQSGLPFRVNGVKFTSVGQYLQYSKCILFGDTDTAQSILETDSASRQYTLARSSEVFYDAVWKGVRQAILIEGLLEQCRQNPDFKEELLSTGEAYLVACAHVDVIYTCGRRINDDKRRDAGKWRGRNVLGFALMEVRRILREEK